MCIKFISNGAYTHLGSDEKDFDIENWKNRKDALILYSSGSTGKSKGIIKSGHSFLCIPNLSLITSFFIKYCLII